jgi:hypothetical protein
LQQSWQAQHKVTIIFSKIRFINSLLLFNAKPIHPQQLPAPIDIIILGAGMTGLTDGLGLSQARNPVTILKVRDRVGG